MTSRDWAHVVNIEEIDEVDSRQGEHWGGFDRRLTPSMRARGGRLGVNLARLPHGRSMCPFHCHQLEDEVFFVLSGRGVLRYGDDVRTIRAGDAVSCPAGTGLAHQIANPFEEDLIYLAIGAHEPHEVCSYPDSGKILVRSLHQLGVLTSTPYLEGELDTLEILELAAEKLGARDPATP